jgi:hypothetical protein
VEELKLDLELYSWNELPIVSKMTAANKNQAEIVNTEDM